MTSWTHLIRFIAVEDHEIHLGQLVDTSRDIGLDSWNNIRIQAYLIHGTIFNSVVTKHILTVKQVSHFIAVRMGSLLTSPAAVGPYYQRRLQLYSVLRIELLGSCEGKDFGTKIHFGSTALEAMLMGVGGQLTTTKCTNFIHQTAVRLGRPLSHDNKYTKMCSGWL